MNKTTLILMLFGGLCTLNFINAEEADSKLEKNPEEAPDLPAKKPAIMVTSDELEAPREILVGGKPIDIGQGEQPAPLVVDWDGDGKKDLLVGQRTEGKLRVYLNTGEDAAPVFKDFEYVEAGGEAAFTECG